MSRLSPPKKEKTIASSFPKTYPLEFQDRVRAIGQEILGLQGFRLLLNKSSLKEIDLGTSMSQTKFSKAVILNLYGKNCIFCFCY